MSGAPRILIVGGGYGGMHTALRLERLLRPGEATITVADPRSYMTYQPLLAEAAAGNLEPRHVVVPLRSVLHRTQIIKATVSSVDHARRVAHLSARRWRGHTAGLRRARAVARVDLPGAPDPRPGRSRHRLQDHR